MALIRRVAAVLVVLLLLQALPVSAEPANAQPGDVQPGEVQPGDGYVKYYVVQNAYGGKPETATEISQRFLGGSDRASEIVGLNPAVTSAGRPLAAGVAVQLPWDAVGAEVMYGRMPEAGTPSSTAPACATGSSRTGDGHWGDDALGIEQAWSHGRGAGVTVAVVDSGVDAAAPELTGHVATGADLTSGRAGDKDCLGSGTAMAGLVIAVAPDATVFPVRVAAGTASVASDARAAEAVQVAVSAGAGIIALGAYVDPDGAATRAMIAAAVAHDVVVVAPAGSRDDARTGDGLLRVGGVGVDGRTAAAYPAGSVEVTAPGIGVATIGSAAAGGTAYAVAYAAGVTALARAGFPRLDARQAELRVEKTAAGGTATTADPSLGYGMIDARAAAAPPDASSPDDASPDDGGLRGLVILLVILTGLGAAFLVWRRRSAAVG